MMRRVLSATVFLLTLLSLSGCRIERHWLKGEVDQVIRAESGDRFFLTLEENATTGYQWQATCDDESVDVIIDHVPPEPSEKVGVPGKAKVTIRVHRGYDGPSTVVFAYRRSWEKEPIRSFTVSMFKRTGDCAFWE